jgi:hypothetical protein
MITPMDHIHHLLVTLAKCDMDAESVWPRVAADGSLSVHIGANDLFYWATAESVEYAPGDEALLDSCLADLQTADPEHGDCHLLDLFCCRKRGMRPQYVFSRFGPDELSPPVRVLFDALGPEGSDKNRG